MNKFRDALYRFMYGRNGVDALNWALVILELAVSILSSIIRVQGVSQALYFVSMMLMFIVLLRRVLPRAEKHRQGRAHVPEVRQEKGRQNVKEKIRPAGRIFL